MARDLTKGSISGSLLFFSLPMILGNLLQQAYNLSDTVIVGQLLGSGPLAAVGSSYALMTFLTSLLTGLSMGSGALLSRDQGAGDTKAYAEDFWYSLLFIGGLAVLLTAGTLLLEEWILDALQIPLDVRGDMEAYVSVVFLGIPLVFLYNFSAFVLRSRGDSVTPLVFLGVSSVLNIVLDVCFVALLGRGIAGAAEATVLSQLVSGIGVTVVMGIKEREVVLSFPREFSSFRFRTVVENDLFTGLQQSVMNFGILMVQGLVNTFGTVVMAAFAASVKIDTLAYMPTQEFGNAYSIFISQNHGAGRLDRIGQGTRVSLLLSAAFSLVASLCIVLLAPRLMQFFISEEEIVREGVVYLRIEGSFYWGIGILFLLYGYFRAIGKPQVSLLLTVVSLGTRVALSYALAPHTPLGVLAIWWSIPIGWAAADATGLLLMKRMKL